MRKGKRICGLILSAALLLNSINITPVHATGNAENGTLVQEQSDVSGGNIPENELLDGEQETGTVDGNDLLTWDGVTTESVYEAENFRVTFSLVSHWSTGYNAQVKIENTGESIIENWCLQCDFDNTISNIWNAQIQDQNDGRYIIKNSGWNQDITVGNSVEFGISGDHAFRGFPQNYELIGTSTEVKTEDYTIEYRVESDWGTGFTGSISITNNTAHAIEDWALDFEFDRSIVSVWNAILEQDDKSKYIIRNAGYNANIASGQTVTFGFTGKGGDAGCRPLNYHLFSFQLEDEEYVTLEDGKIDKDYLYRAIYTYLLMWDMSINNVRLSDDYDGDGLTLAEEYNYDTNPFSKDTDEDGIDDYSEINQYGTNPIKYDTDQDEMCDGTEIACGLNPLLKDTDGDGVLDNRETTCQSVRIYSVESYSLDQVDTLPAVQITGEGDFDKKIYVSAIKNNETILDIDCIVGTAYDFVHDDDLSFESSTISFEISQKVQNRYSLDDLAIAWYNEQENVLELLDTYVDNANNSIYASVDHYSTYMVVSVPDYFFDVDWENKDSIIEAGKADVVFVVDTTGSMSGVISNVKNNITTFVSDLEKNKVDIRLGLVEYKDIYSDGIGSTKSYDWYTKVSDFKEKLSRLGVSGGGDTPESVVDALYCARNMKYRTGVKKYIIVITDANYKNGTSADKNATLADEIEKLRNDEISASVVTVPYYYSTYSALVNGTDGINANVNQNFAAALKPLIDKMGRQVNNGCWVRLSNGSVVCLDKDPALGDETIDTDKDGIPDIIELNSTYIVKARNPYTGTLQEINSWTFYSNPAKADTDGDGFIDVDDLRPAIYDVVIVAEEDNYIKFNTGRTWFNISCTAYDYMDNILQVVDLNADNPIPLDEFQEIISCVSKNKEQQFNIDELTVIGILNNEGSKLYMHDLTDTTREIVFKKIAGRESRYYRHSGIWWNENWSVVPKGTESGFFKGTVLSESDINFSWKIYTVCDVYSVLTFVAQAGALVIAIVLIAEVTPIVIANVEALVYYVSTFGVVQGLQMYQNLGIQQVPDGIISFMQMDLADGDSSLDDLADAAVPIYQRGIKGEEALQILHPGESQVYFKTYVNGVLRGRYIDQLSNTVAYEAKVGYTCKSKFVEMQVLKDAYLLNNNENITKVVWEFFRSDITGQVGASKELLQLLEENGIEYIIHW